MLDIKLLRENPKLIKESLAKRNITFPLDEILDSDRKRRVLVTASQKLKEQKNRVSIEISDLRKRGEDAKDKITEMRMISQRIDESDHQVASLEERIEDLMMRIPNLPDPSLPEGKDETGNLHVRYWGEIPKFPFKARDHIDLGLFNGLLDIERAGKTSGSRFYFLKGDLVRLNQGLIQFGLDFMKGRGFEFVQPPYMLNKKAMAGAVILSDFEDVIYKVEGEELYLIGTSEHAIAAMHMNEIFDVKDLPLRYAGVSPCFRKEAGAHGRDTKGIFRVHQFEKVEQFVFCRPDDSQAELEALLRNSEEFYRDLGIPYRVALLCTGDLGKTAAKTYDIEAWLPGQDAYREVVSCSNCTDYQARRLRIMYREKPHAEAKLVHTLNSTLVATERTLIAIMENYQGEDGRSLTIPRALRPYMGGQIEIMGSKPDIHR